MQSRFTAIDGDVLQYVEVLEPRTIEWYGGLPHKYIANVLYGNGVLHGMAQTLEVYALHDARYDTIDGAEQATNSDCP
jgi:hypothetical protein